MWTNYFFLILAQKTLQIFNIEMKTKIKSYTMQVIYSSYIYISLLYLSIRHRSIYRVIPYQVNQHPEVNLTDFLEIFCA